MNQYIVEIDYAKFVFDEGEAALAFAEVARRNRISNTLFFIVYKSNSCYGLYGKKLSRMFVLSNIRDNILRVTKHRYLRKWRSFR